MNTKARVLSTKSKNSAPQHALVFCENESFFYQLPYRAADGLMGAAKLSR
jgi:hypothetical protein